MTWFLLQRASPTTLRDVASESAAAIDVLLHAPERDNTQSANSAPSEPGLAIASSLVVTWG
jgi:hypothetical protein